MMIAGQNFLIAVVEAAHRHGRELFERYQGDSRQLMEFLIAESPAGTDARASEGAGIGQGKLTKVLASLRENRNILIEDVRANLNESIAFLASWIAALDGYCADGAADEKWRARMLADWRKLCATIEAARVLFEVRTAAVTRLTDPDSARRRPDA